MTGTVSGYVRDAQPGEWLDRECPRGYRLVVVDEIARSSEWRAARPGRRCRYQAGGPTCKRLAVVELDRSHPPDRHSRWYGYCDDPAHLYGRRWDGGRLLACILVEERPLTATDRVREPHNLLAVVIDNQGRRYFRWSYDVHTFTPWQLMGAVHVHDEEPELFRWDDLPAVTIISSGVGD